MIIYYTDNYDGSRESSRMLLQKALAVHTGDEYRAKTLIGELKKGEHGKPFIEGFSCFSISHSGSIWAVIIAEKECGLDIQHIRSCDMEAIAERWFAPDDVSAVKSSKSDQQDSFFHIWTRREALVKALGITVYDTGLPPVSGDDVIIDDDRYIFRDIQIPQKPELYAALCICSRESVSDPDLTLL